MTDFQEVYDLYFREVYRYALSLCRNESIAEEITQETFYKALAKLDSFDGKCKISVWLCQIAKNTYISMCRKDKYLDPNVKTDLSQGGEIFEEIKADVEKTMSKSITATPTIEINGVIYVGAMPYDKLIERIDLAQKRTEN